MFVTIISALAIFISSQFFLELVLKPLIRYKEAIYSVDSNLKFYANRIGTQYALAKEDEYTKTVDVIRKLSCELEASYKQIFAKGVFEKVRLVPIGGDVAEACARLIRISNSVGQSGVGIYDDIKEIRHRLGISPLND